MPYFLTIIPACHSSFLKKWKALITYFLVVLQKDYKKDLETEIKGKGMQVSTDTIDIQRAKKASEIASQVRKSVLGKNKANTLTLAMESEWPSTHMALRSKYTNIKIIMEEWAKLNDDHFLFLFIFFPERV